MPQTTDYAISRIVEKWHTQMEGEYLSINSEAPPLRRAYICSPCKAPTPELQRRNMLAARFYAWYAHENLDLRARAPHAYLPTLLNDHIPAERALALHFGLELLEQSELVLVCGTRLSSGMRNELTRAAQLGIPVLVFADTLFQDVRKLYTRAGGDKALVEQAQEQEQNYLAYDADQLFN